MADQRVKFDPQKHHRRSIRLPGYDYARAGAYFVTLVTHQRQCLFGEVVEGEMVLNDLGRIVQWEWMRLPQRFQYIELGAYIVMPNHFHGILIFHDDTVGATRRGLTVDLSGGAGLHDEVLAGIAVGATRQGIAVAHSGEAGLQDDVLSGNAVGATRPGMTIAHSGEVGLQDDVLSGNDGSPLHPRGPQPSSLGAIMAQFKSRVTKRLWKTPALHGAPIWQRNYHDHIIRSDDEMARIWRYIESNPARWAADDENPRRGP